MRQGRPPKWRERTARRRSAWTCGPLAMARPGGHWTNRRRNQAGHNDPASLRTCAPARPRRRLVGLVRQVCTRARLACSAQRRTRAAPHQFCQLPRADDAAHRTGSQARREVRGHSATRIATLRNGRTTDAYGAGRPRTGEDGSERNDPIRPGQTAWERILLNGGERNSAVLKTARAREGPRGFESHALRSEHRKRLLTSSDVVRSRYIAVWLCLAASGRLRLAVPNTCPSCVGHVPRGSPSGGLVASSIRRWASACCPAMHLA